MRGNERDGERKANINGEKKERERKGEKGRERNTRTLFSSSLTHCRFAVPE